MTDYQVTFLGQKNAALVTAEIDEKLTPHELLGENIISLISTGSERGGYTQLFRPEQYPMRTGSSSIARVIAVGSGVTRYKTGDLFFHGEYHSLYTKTDESETVPVPKELLPEHALFARYAAVSMTSIYRMKSRPVDGVIVSGLGLVGLMCAQTLSCFGYAVYATDPSPERRAIAEATCKGRVKIVNSINELEGLGQSIGTLMECSGNENALRDAIPFLRKGGEVFQIGVPWQKNGDYDTNGLLRDIFYGFISLHSGFEWLLPKKPTETEPHCNYSHIASVMDLIADGRVNIIPQMYELRRPNDCADVYAEISRPRMNPTSVMFEWRAMEHDKS